MGKVMSKEKDARDVALKEYDKFMDKFKVNVEAGDMKLMQHMLKLEADKIRTQSVLESIENSSPIASKSVYDLDEYKMKLQMTKEQYHEDQKPESDELISIGDPDKKDIYRLDPFNFGQITEPEPKKEVEKKTTSVVSVDPKTGKKVYKGPKLRSKKVVDGKMWDETHPNFHDKNVGGM